MPSDWGLVLLKVKNIILFNIIKFWHYTEYSAQGYITFVYTNNCYNVSFN